MAWSYTESGNNTATTLWSVVHPMAVAGDLLIFNIGWDDSTTVDSLSVPNGPNGETPTTIEGITASSGTAVRGLIVYYIATGSWGANSLTFTASALEQWTAVVIRVPKNEFDPSNPIGASNDYPSSSTTTSPQLPALTAGSTDGGGTLVGVVVGDADNCDNSISGWTSQISRDRGAVAIDVLTSDTAVTNSESISAATGLTFPSARAYVSFIYIVRVLEETISPITYDLFESSLDTGLWTVIDPRSDSTVTTNSGQLSISVPSGTSHNYYNTEHNGVMVVQEIGDVNFVIEAKFNSDLGTTTHARQGLVAKTEYSNRYFVFDTYTVDSSDIRAYSAYFYNDTQGSVESSNITNSEPYWLRIKRVGELFSCYYSYDGESWTLFSETNIPIWQFGASMVIESVGVIAGNTTNDPAHIALIEYFGPISPVAITKSLIYEIASSATSQSITKGLDYEVRSEVGINKGLVYEVVSANAPITKSLVYEVIATVTATTKVLAYEVSNSLIIQKSFVYEVESEQSPIVKNMAYEILTTASITKGLNYEIITTTTEITKTLNYEIRTDSVAQKALNYEIRSSVTIQKGMAYGIGEFSSITKGMEYRVRTSSTALTRSLTYEIITSADSISKTLSYSIQTFSEFQKAMSYEVVTSEITQKGLTYQIESENTPINKGMTYKVVSSTAIDKGMDYEIRTDTVITKALAYEIDIPEETTETIQKSLSYAIYNSGIGIDKGLSYEILTTTSAITKALEYDIRSEASPITKVLTYKILANASPIQLNMGYNISADIKLYVYKNGQWTQVNTLFIRL